MLFSKVADNGQPLDSRIAFRYFWLVFRANGMYPPQRHRIAYMIYSLITNLVNGIGWPGSLLLKLLFINSFEDIINNIFLSINIFLSTVQQAGLFLFRKSFRDIDQYLAKLDQRSMAHAEDRAHIFNAIHVAHFLFSLYVSTYTFCCFGFSYISFTTGEPICEGWLPRFFEEPEKNMMVSVLYQNVALYSFTIIQSVNNDCYPMCYIAVGIGHLRALSARIRRIGKQPIHDLDANFRELVECIKDYKNILNYYDCIRPIIATTIFMQFLGTAVILVISVIKVTVFSNTMTQKIFIGVYACLVMSEVFPCCWFAETLILENSAVTQAIYGCDWYSQHKKFRKMLVTFMMRTQQFKLIMAGNLYPVNLDTFVAIMKFSFSIYTLLTQMNMK